MKPPRLNKLRSNLVFLNWLASHFLRRISGKHAQSLHALEVDLVAQGRVDYYCKANDFFVVETGKLIRDVPYFQNTGYNYDFHQLMEPFSKIRFHHLWGDIKHVPERPTFVRSRPIGDKNQNSVLLPVNTRRLFETFRDPYHLKNKKPIIVWRGAVYKQHRIDLLKSGERLSFCDFGATNSENPELQRWIRPWMTPKDQMQHKFIFVVEGNDIASNIKWVMASNSVCMMRRPRFESWFAEGRLKPGEHYIEVADDFSDIEQKFDYYLKNPQEIERIISSANSYVNQFGSLKVEYTIGQAVIAKYASLSRQRTTE